MRINASAVMAVIMIILLFSGANAEKHEDAWVMCQPDSEVSVRMFPNRHSDVVARVFPGDRLILSGKKRGRWYHVDLVCETGEGWIRGDYLSFTEPVFFPGGSRFRTTRKNVRARYSIRGNIRKKLKKGSEVLVYLWTDDWCVTSQGYIMSKYLEVADGA